MFPKVSLVMGLAVFLIAGCGPEDKGPQVVTFPVTGKVLDTSGKPVTGGMLSLRSTTNAEQVASAVLDDTGSFKLKSLVREQLVEGAQPGEYKVMFAPKTVQQTDPPVVLKQTYTIKEGQETLEIKLE